MTEIKRIGLKQRAIEKDRSLVSTGTAFGEAGAYPSYGEISLARPFVL